MMALVPASLIMRMLQSVVAGVLASAALPPLGLTVLIFALALPFRHLSASVRQREAFLLGWATGSGWFFISLWWISKAFVTSGGAHIFLIPLVALGLPLFLGLFWGAAFWLAFVATTSPVARLLLLAAVLSLAEYSRGFVLTGFPWNAPGMIFANADLTITAAATFGLWGLSLIALLIPLLPLLVMMGQKRAVLGVVLMLATVPAAMVAGHMIDETPAATSAMSVRIVQPNIDQRDKWDRQQRPDHLVRLMELSRRSGDEASDLYPDLIVWPETAFAGFISDERVVFDAVTGAASGGMSTLLTGALRLEGQQILSFFNTAALISPDGSLTATYDKQHLVPFGEYAPLRQYLPFVDAIAGPADFTPGQGKAAMAMQRRDGTTVSILPLICFEVIFPAAVRDAVLAEDIDLLVTITNDAWFGDTIGPRQHLAMARMRSAELGLPMLRAANTGISSVIDARGREVARLGYGRHGTINTSLGGVVDTPYRRSGETGFVLLLLILAVMAGHYQGLTALLSRR